MINKNLIRLILILAVLTALAGCGVRAAEKHEGDTVLRNGELQLTIPADYAQLVKAETPSSESGEMLFSVSETASLEAAKAQGEPEDSGAGWLFGIRRITLEELNEMLAGDMSGMEVMAGDDAGFYYLFCHPTDVRMVRANNEEMQKDIEQWTRLNEWASSVRESFVKENSSLHTVEMEPRNGYTPEDLLGRWAEKIAGRGLITISESGKEGEYTVEIHWGSSAFESVNWTMTALPTGNGGELAYDDARCFVRTYTSETEFTDAVKYENGTGRFILNSANEIMWQDDMEQAGDNTVFISVD